MSDLYWHCARCGAHEPVDPKGEGCNLGDEEKCITCSDDPPGMARVMTLQDAARIEQRHALRDMNSTVAREMLKPATGGEGVSK